MDSYTSTLRVMPEILDSKMVYISPSSLMPAVIISFIGSQLTTSLLWLYYLTGMIMMPVVLWHIGGFTYHNDIRIYIETAIVVVITYVSLLIVNWSHIWLVVFPIIAIGFIIALCNELNHHSESGSGSQQQRNDGEEASTSEKAVWLVAVALVPYWALFIMGQFNADELNVSQFLLFFGSMLGTLTLMMTRLELIVVDRGIAPASELLRKASLVVLLVAVHAVAAEFLGENVVLVCLPEIAPVLLWFSVHLDRDNDAIITADKISFDWNNVLVLLGVTAAVFAILAGYMDESVLYWCTRALVSCGVSGLLIYYIVFMLWQWPGQDGTATPFAKETVTLLIKWANVLLTVATMLLVLSRLVSVLQGLQEPIIVTASPHTSTNV